MNRRNFLSLAALAIAGKAAERVFPFRVYSIPKEIVVAPCPITLHLAGDAFYASLVNEADRLFGGARGGQKNAALLAQMSRDQDEAWKVIRSIIHPYPKAILPPVDWYSTDTDLMKHWYSITAPQSARS